ADLEKLIDRFENLYAEVLTGARRPYISPEAHEHAVARFLHEYLPRRPNDIRWPWTAERDQMQRERRSLEALIHDLNNQLTLLKRSRLLKMGRLLRRPIGLGAPYGLAGRFVRNAASRLDSAEALGQRGEMLAEANDFAVDPCRHLLLSVRFINGRVLEALADVQTVTNGAEAFDAEPVEVVAAHGPR